MTKNEAVYFAFYVDDWYGGTKAMNHVEKACYLELLLWQFAHGEIPDDYRKRMLICGVHDPAIWKDVWHTLSDKFSVGDDGKYRNPKMDKERQRAIDNRQLAVESGKKGAAKRWNNHSPPNRPPIGQAIANQNQNQNQSKNHKPEPKNKWAAPSVSDIVQYCQERQNDVNAQAFHDYYTAQGWKLANGRAMKDWKAAVRTWENRRRKAKFANLQEPL